MRISFNHSFPRALNQYPLLLIGPHFGEQVTAAKAAEAAEQAERSKQAEELNGQAAQLGEQKAGLQKEVKALKAQVAELTNQAKALTTADPLAEVSSLRAQRNDLQQQIKIKEGKIAELDRQINTKTTQALAKVGILPKELAPQDEPAAPPAPVLAKGAKGADVEAIQKQLLAKGAKLPRYGADKDYGGETVAAVVAFQRKNGLPETGVVDAATRAKLFA